MDLIVLAIAALSGILLLSTFIWSKISYSWLPQVCRFLVLSLPFERIPSIEVGGVSLRISQVLVMIGFWFLLILFLKQDQKLLEKKLNPFNVLSIIFLISTIPSWFGIVEMSRFLVHMIGTILVLAAAFLLSNFTENVLESIRELVVTMVVVCVFGVYQFIGDMLNFPIELTGLRAGYTKIIFGIPRVHSTALEPLYFAGMLFLPILATFVFIVAHKKIIQKKILYSNLVLLGLFIGLFIATLSKGAYVALALTFPLFIFISGTKFSLIKLLKSISWLGLVIVLGFFLLTFFSPSLLSVSQGLLEHFDQSINLQSASSAQRVLFVETALVLLPNFIITGIGGGQYGEYALNLLPVLAAGENTLIVNNVYLEVWLEFGIISLFCFLVLIGQPVLQSWFHLQKSQSWSEDDNLARFILIATLVTYYIQWLFFSPIFIMPIFICLGLLARLESGSKAN